MRGVPCDKLGPDPHNGGAVLWQYQPICKRKDPAAPPVPQVVALSSNPNDVLRTQCANDNMIEVGQVKIGYGGYHMARACAGLIAADERCSADFHYFFDGLCACVPKGETCDVNDSAPNNRMAFRIVPGTPYEPASPPPPTPQQNYCRSKPSDAREAYPWCLRTTFPAWLDGCFDTPLWTNGITDGDTTHGAATCEFYVFKEWCANGALLDPTYGGEAYNFPEQNCCACGKKGVGDAWLVDDDGAPTTGPSFEYCDVPELSCCTEERKRPRRRPQLVPRAVHGGEHVGTSR